MREKSFSPRNQQSVINVKISFASVLPTIIRTASMCTRLTTVRTWGRWDNQPPRSQLCSRTYRQALSSKVVIATELTGWRSSAINRVASETMYNKKLNNFKITQSSWANEPSTYPSAPELPVGTPTTTTAGTNTISFHTQKVTTLGQPTPTHYRLNEAYFEKLDASWVF